ncbi:hypothetical protein ACFE04_007704 [Oxalis oulophora]
MGYINYHKTKHLIISLLLLFLASSSFIQGRLIAEDNNKPISKLLQSSHSQKGLLGEEKTMVVRIGSRPPRCEKRCNSCGHCEAVQVPVNTQTHKRTRLSSSTIISQHSNMLYSRGDDISNYKPMSWKCKCGNIIFNP